MRLPQTLHAGGLALWSSAVTYALFSRFISGALAQGLGQPGGTCSDSIPCYQGCYSKDNSCGFTPDHCGSGCQSNYNATAECGQNAAPANFDCPINVCCSAFGFCGVTTDFCGKGCEPNSKGGGCGQPDHPTCSESTDAMAYDRRIRYYELFNIHKSCNVIEPESLVIEPFSYINLAFVNFGADYKLLDEYGDVVDRMSFLKFTNTGLRINIAIGGWTFSDPPTELRWSQMARSYENRQTFISSVVNYLQNYHLDGVNLDWEYPSAADRGGSEDDAANYVTLLAEIREAFDRENPGWEISVTVPTSYWYLRGFDVERMQEHVDYINLMSYDLHGMWDQDSEWTGPYLEGHTDISQIELGLDLLWRNNIDPANVVFGFAFYGRSFTMKDEDCTEPNRKCQFSTGGAPGTCTDTAGILSYAEISSRNNSLDVHTHYDAETTVKYNVYQGSQWVSYDDEQSFTDKKKFISKHCLSGWMV